MLQRLVVIAFFLVIAVPAASAASFDCTKAATSIEQAICNTPDLSMADDLLAKAYATATGGLSDAALSVMKQGQHDWLAFRNADCGDAALPDGDQAKGRIDCLSTAYSERVSTLEASRMSGGLRFYTADRYAVVPDPEAADSGAKVATKILSYPLIDGQDALAKAFNAMIEDRVRPAQAMFGKPTGADDDMASGDSDNETTYTATSTPSGPIAVTANDYWYGHGAAHPNYAVSYLNFRRDKMRLITAEDVFAGKAWRSKLHDMVMARLKADLGDGMMLDDPKSIDPLITDPTRWSFDEQGLDIQFEPYEVAPYAAGAVTVSLPWPKLQNILADGAGQATGY